jgi:hypothetical protein
MNAAEILQQAKVLLITAGWARRAAADGPYCAALAVAAAGGRYPEVQYLAHALGVRNCVAVFRWNDDPATTFSDVMDLYDEAILLAKEAEA